MEQEAGLVTNGRSLGTVGEGLKAQVRRVLEAEGEHQTAWSSLLPSPLPAVIRLKLLPLVPDRQG